MAIDLLSLVIGVVIGLISFGFGAAVMNWLLSKRDKPHARKLEEMAPKEAEEILDILSKYQAEKEKSEEEN
jgi:hypothetical protein